MKDIQSIASQMTLEEKTSLCTGDTAWTTQAVGRLPRPAEVMIAEMLDQVYGRAA